MHTNRGRGNGAKRGNLYRCRPLHAFLTHPLQTFNNLLNQVSLNSGTLWHAVCHAADIKAARLTVNTKSTYVATSIRYFENLTAYYDRRFPLLSSSKFLNFSCVCALFEHVVKTRDLL